MESTITVKGQATIPKPARDHLGLKPGDRVKFFVHPDGSVVTMVETVWVLERAYGLADRDIAAAVERILQIGTFRVESEQDVFTAMTVLRQGRGSFADALIGALGTRAGCSRTLTFDRKASRLPGFALVS